MSYIFPDPYHVFRINDIIITSFIVNDIISCDNMTLYIPSDLILLISTIDVSRSAYLVHTCRFLSFITHGIFSKPIPHSFKIRLFRLKIHMFGLLRNTLLHVKLDPEPPLYLHL